MRRVSPEDEGMEKKLGIDRTYVEDAGSGPPALAKRVEQLLGLWRKGGWGVIDGNFRWNGIPNRVGG